MAYLADRAFELIASAQERGRLAHAFLISGAHGSGKENLAARMIQLVNGAGKSGGFDLFGEPVVVATPPLDELESGWVRIIRPRMKSRRIGVDQIRDLEQTLHLAAPGGACKVGVITEADRMNDQAANAFLKTLEEPPRNTLLLLLTANPQRLLPTVISRCTRLPLLGGEALLAVAAGAVVAALVRTRPTGEGARSRGAITHGGDDESLHHLVGRHRPERVDEQRHRQTLIWEIREGAGKARDRAVMEDGPMARD